jgi:ring-1,2-phenylacetyl-CoA epoxidase subunit PaaC
MSPPAPTPATFPYLLSLGDDRLILGHRLSEWCGHGPILEEDIALTNIALDLIGQATLFLKLAAAAEGKGRGEDDLAFLRDDIAFRNVLLAELPRGDFAFTVVRQLLFSVFSLLQMEALASVGDVELAGVAAKAAKETRYHVRHATQWVVTLGDGTEESHGRAQAALDDLWRYTGELFIPTPADVDAVNAGCGVNPETLAAAWRAQIGEILRVAGLTQPSTGYMQRGGREGRHTEYLGHLLSEMQILARSHPGAQW